MSKYLLRWVLCLGGNRTDFGGLMVRGNEGKPQILNGHRVGGATESSMGACKSKENEGRCLWRELNFTGR